LEDGKRKYSTLNNGMWEYLIFNPSPYLDIVAAIIYKCGEGSPLLSFQFYSKRRKTKNQK